MAKDNKDLYHNHPGWKSLIDPILASADAMDGEVVEIHEKWGVLKIEYIPGNDLDEAMEQMIEAAAQKSATTCELCGHSGSLRFSKGWYKTLCDGHARELGYGEIA